MSNKSFRSVLHQQQVRVNGKIERFAGVLLGKGDVVEVASDWERYLPKPWAKSASRDPDQAFETLVDQPHFRIVNKPDGWVCSPERCREQFGPDVQLVHRLDKGTTGALMLAKSTASRADLMRAFATGKVEKRYLAIVDGVPPALEGTSDTFLMRSTDTPYLEGQTHWHSIRTVPANGQSSAASKGIRAITNWRVLSKGDQAALLLCQPITGRTHQIRVHLAELNHPILVDRQYASHFRSSYFATRPLLHSYQLILEDGVIATAPLPLDMQQAMHHLGLTLFNH